MRQFTLFLPTDAIYIQTRLSVSQNTIHIIIIVEPITYLSERPAHTTYRF